MKRTINLFSQNEIKHQITTFMNKMTTWNIVILVVLVVTIIGSSSFLIYQSNVNVVP